MLTKIYINRACGENNCTMYDVFYQGAFFYALGAELIRICCFMGGRKRAIMRAIILKTLLNRALSELSIIEATSACRPTCN